MRGIAIIAILLAVWLIVVGTVCILNEFVDTMSDWWVFGFGISALVFGALSFLAHHYLK